MKKVLSVSLVSFLFILLASSTVSGYEMQNRMRNTNNISKMDSKIFDQISDAQNKAQDLVDRYNREVIKLQKSKVNNKILKSQILGLTDKLNSEIDALVNNLIDKTNSESRDVIIKAGTQVVDVTSEYIPVEIGGRTVLVDPSRVIGI